MTELNDLYQDVLLDHYKAPRNFGKIEPCTHDAAEHNPLCGDNLHLYLEIENECIKNIGFEGSGCAISVASASLMSIILKGKSVAEAMKIFQSFHTLLTTEEHTPPFEIEKLGKLVVLEGVKKYPMRVKCATLSWHAFEAALQGKESISTEEGE